MTQYEHALLAMEKLLSAVGEEHWAAWMRDDLNCWRSATDASHHLAAYGAMGSLNDLFICRANKHRISDAQEPWANVLFDWLKGVCYYFARHPHTHVDANNLAKIVGRDESSLSAFVGGNNVAASFRGYAGADHRLSGWRCLACGHAEISIRDVDYFLAEDTIPWMVFRACENMMLGELVDKALALDIPGIEESRRALTHSAEASGIVVHEREGWMRLCPKCGMRASAVAAWRFLRLERRLEPWEAGSRAQWPPWLPRLLQAFKRLFASR